MSTPFLGSILSVAFDFAPKGYVSCNGQLLAINQNQALFAVLGTTYGGNGVQNFALPNLQGRAALSSGQGQGLQDYVLGQIAGEESVTVNTGQLPMHNHLCKANSGGATTKNPSGGVLCGIGMYNASPPDSAAGFMAAGEISHAGGSQPHENRTPYLVINWIIALQGIFPSRS
ncbi:MAG: tail fiber protein [Bryobacteraceae bacterium]|jgi:microcystin-dependent protein